jgi:hypothetical protein
MTATPMAMVSPMTRISTTTVTGFPMKTRATETPTVMA